MIVVYNLSLALCMKAPYIFMPLLIVKSKDPTKDLLFAVLHVIEKTDFVPRYNIHGAGREHIKSH